MGYLTKHYATGSLAAISRLREMSECASVGLEPDGSFSGEAVKWYDCEIDLTKLAKEMPTETLTIKGKGEDNSDIWETRMQDGKVETRRARIEFDAWASAARRHP